MPWSLYLATLNEAGKITARSIMDILTVVLETIEEIEKETKTLEKVPETVGEILEAIKPEEPKTITDAEKISEVTTESINKNLPEAILGDKPPEIKA